MKAIILITGPQGSGKTEIANRFKFATIIDAIGIADEHHVNKIHAAVRGNSENVVLISQIKDPLNSRLFKSMAENRNTKFIEINLV